MTQIFDRRTRLIRKDQELEKLFEQAASRRKRLLQQKNANIENSHVRKDSTQVEKFILKPLRSSDNLVATDTNYNTVEIILQRNSSYYSHENLQERSLDCINASMDSQNINLDNNNYSHEDTVKSSDNVNKAGHHNPSFVTYSSSSDEVDISNYCQFIPATSYSTNTTNSSHYSKTDNSLNKFSGFDPSSSDPCHHSTKEFDNSEPQHASVVFYPSGSPLISHKYQGSPVVRIDNKLRAGEAEFLYNRPKPPLGKPPLMPRHPKLRPKPVTCVAKDDKRLSHPVLVDINDYDKVPSSPISVENANSNPTSIIRRTKKKLLEEHMRKRFSVGDYSTRSLIEWENNLSCAAIEHFSMSGDMRSANESEEFSIRKLSSQSDGLFPLDIIESAHNFSSEVNILHCNSTDSFKEVQVSFSLKNEKVKDDTPNPRHSERLSKRSNFLQRSMNDIATALRNVRLSEKDHSSKKFFFSNRSHFINQGIFKKRDSTSSDLLYSVPPFARKHLPPDISGATKIISQDTYQHFNLPSSTPNLIAELDPTFQERYPLEASVVEIPLARNPLSKRNRSYRLSFIENAHTVTTKKLTAASATTSPLNAAVPRFVQPRRRMGSRNSAMIKRQESPKMEPRRNNRSRSSNRFSCAQQ